MTTFRTTRDIPASSEEVFAAFSDPRRLARWWGPVVPANEQNLDRLSAEVLRGSGGG
jgi:uncharacterized protein YndB with AHSA1/START domain